MPDRRLTDEDYEMLASFRFALRRFLSFSEVAAKRHGLTPRQHQALLGIRSMRVSGSASVSDLAAFLILQHNSTVELINRLALAELVVRVVDPDDARRVQLSLTDKGEELLDALTQAHLDEFENIGSELRELLIRIDRYKRGRARIAPKADDCNTAETQKAVRLRRMS